MPDEQPSVPAIKAPPVKRDNPLTRSVAGILGLAVLSLIVLACLGSLPWTATKQATDGTEVLPVAQQRFSPGYDAQRREARHLAPWWMGAPAKPALAAGVELDALPESEAKRYWVAAERAALIEIARERKAPIEELAAANVKPTEAQINATQPKYWLGSDLLGRSLLVRCLVGGGISLGIGIAAATLSVILGTLWGTIAGWFGGRIDGVMMRIVDVLYGLPYILLVVLLAVASEAALDEYLTREGARKGYVDEQVRLVLREQKIEPTRSAIREYLKTNLDVKDQLQTRAQTEYPERPMKPEWRTAFDLITLLVAIGGVSWLTMARVVRGQVLSLKSQPFIEAARAVGAPTWWIFVKHLLPNLVGPITVYATLTVPQAILQESFLSFLGIGVKPPLPSWGNLAADGLQELNTVQSHWWLLVFPCVLLAVTLLALNFVGEGLREALDPKRGRR